MAAPSTPSNALLGPLPAAPPHGRTRTRGRAGTGTARDRGDHRVRRLLTMAVLGLALPLTVVPPAAAAGRQRPSC
ncbi:hypothetical protein ACFVXQ_04485, partial [Kitasatospora sp. NPDC058263]